MVKEKKEKKAVISQGNLGSLLREYREIAGYSLTQMAEALCLSEETLVDLEKEDFKKLPEPPYVRGYLRNYAKLAEKDPAQLINHYESLRGADPSDLDYHFKTKPTILTDSKRKLSPVMGQLLLLSLLLLFLGGISMIPAVNKWITNTWNSFSEQTRQQENLNNQDLMGEMPIPTPLIPEENGTGSDTQENTEANAKNTKGNSATSTTKTAEADNTSSTQTPSTGTSTSTKQETTQANLESSKNQTIANKDEIRIKLIFNKEVWMKIQDGNNKTVFEALNPAGGSKDLVLKKPLHFRVGNAQGLSLFVDDQAVDISSYIKGSVAKFTLE